MVLLAGVALIVGFILGSINGRRLEREKQLLEQLQLEFNKKEAELFKKL